MKVGFPLWSALAALLLLVPAGQAEASPTSPGLTRLVGVASWYGGRHLGRHTASGEILTAQARTAAHRSLPLGALVRVTNLKNGKSSLVKINDRGPFVAGRLIDLSEQAARDLGMIEDGLANVRLELIFHCRPTLLLGC